MLVNVKFMIVVLDITYKSKRGLFKPVAKNNLKA